jgi:hypothetical protein
MGIALGELQHCNNCNGLCQLNQEKNRRKMKNFL